MPDSTSPGSQRAITHQSAGDLDAAIADLRIVIDNEPDDVDALLQLGSLLLATGAEDEANELLARADESG